MIAQLITGTKATLPTLLEGQFGLCYDTGDLFIGSQSGNIQIYAGNSPSLIGQPIAIEGTELPDITRYIELTKDLTGVGQYNEGKLSGQAFVDVSQQRYYTAVVSDPDSPMFGQTIKLRNSVFDISSGSEVASYSFIGAGETSGVFIPNQSQSHRHNPLTGAGFLITSVTQPNTSVGSYNLGNSAATTGNPTTDGTNGTYRGGRFNIPNTITARLFMRYKS